MAKLNKHLLYDNLTFICVNICLINTKIDSKKDVILAINIMHFIDKTKLNIAFKNIINLLSKGICIISKNYFEINK